MKFYVPIDDYDGPHDKAGEVYAISGDHFSPGWVSCGFVSKQTPHGQGIFCGFKWAELRDATPDEVLGALEKNHPHGKNFRPRCRKAMNASFHLVMSRAIGNWTNDELRCVRPVHDVSRQEIVDAAQKAQAKHDAMLDRWDEITSGQREAIRAQFQERA